MHLAVPYAMVYQYLTRKNSYLLKLLTSEKSIQNSPRLKQFSVK